ncbi:MAG TPA: hypothetical protein VMU34_25015 [Mycobacterium sp.]|nr:hypothetical protein [Mycobacterium sp.]
MLTMRDHGVEDYAALPDMDATDVGVLGEDDYDCLDELGHYLADSDAWQRFSVWLLHKHFEPGPGEVFVERASTEPRRTETTLIERSVLPGLTASSIRFEELAGGDVGVVGMEFAAPEEFGDTAPLSDEDEAVLAGILERLRAYGKTDRFGVRLIRNPLGLSEDELLHETCDSARRALRCDVGVRDEVLADRTVVQTAWWWKVVQGRTEPAVMRDCTVSCVRAGEGHDIEHTVSQPDVYD